MASRRKCIWWCCSGLQYIYCDPWTSNFSILIYFPRCDFLWVGLDCARLWWLFSFISLPLLFWHISFFFCIFVKVQNEKAQNTAQRWIKWYVLCAHRTQPIGYCRAWDWWTSAKTILMDYFLVARGGGFVPIKSKSWEVTQNDGRVKYAKIKYGKPITITSTTPTISNISILQPIGETMTKAKAKAAK